MLAYLKAHVAWVSAVLFGVAAFVHASGIVPDSSVLIILSALSGLGLYVAPSPVFASDAKPPEAR